MIKQLLIQYLESLGEHEQAGLRVAKAISYIELNGQDNLTVEMKQYVLTIMREIELAYYIRRLEAINDHNNLTSTLLAWIEL